MNTTHYHMWWASQPYPDAVPFTTVKACTDEIARQRSTHRTLRKEVVEIVAIKNHDWRHYRIVRSETNRLGRLTPIGGVA